MQAPDWFGVALRVLGVWFLYEAGSEVIIAVVKRSMPITSNIPLGETEIFVGYYLFVAIVLLVFADHVVELLYGPRVKGESENTARSLPD